MNVSTAEANLFEAAEQLKEKFIKWATIKHGLDFFDHVDLSKCTDGFELDADLVNEDGVHALTGFDTTWTLASVSARAAELAEEDEMIQNLQTTLQPLITRPELAVEVEKLMDKELKQSDRPNKTLTGMNTLNGKAHLLAQYRATKQKIRRSPEYKDNIRKYEFEVYFKALHYGYSEIVNTTKLFFKYDTPFYEFLRTLREQTLFSTVPPRVLQEESIPSERSPTRETSRTLSIHEDDQEAAASNLNPSTSLADEVPMKEAESPPQEEPIEIVTQSQRAKIYKGGVKDRSSTKSQATRLPRSPSEKGYSLNDGPWRCKILIRLGTTGSEAAFRDIANKDDYNRLLDELKKLSSSSSERNKVLIMHSMDRAAWDLWNNKRTEEWKEYKSLMAIREGDPEYDPNEEGDNEGESYSDWLLKNLLEKATASNGLRRPSRNSSTRMRHPMSSSPPLSSWPGCRESSSPDFMRESSKASDRSTPIVIDDD